MKRLFPIFALATLVAMSLVSCKPSEVKLHPSVGEIYHSAAATSTMAGDGIVFYVDENEGYALICSMNDLKRDRQTSTSEILPHLWESDFTWSVFGTDTVMERDTMEADIVRASIRKYKETKTVDSIVNDNGIVEHFLQDVFEYEENRGMKIYPANIYIKNEQWVAFEGNLLPADSIVRKVDTTWKTPAERDSIIRLDTTWSVLKERYSDTLWNYFLESDIKKSVIIDTNWSFSLISGLGEDDPDGKLNTDKIMNGDIPHRRTYDPDSSSAARTCREYFTRKYVQNKAELAKDTAFKAGTIGEWFLPSRAELRHLFDARTKINEMNAGMNGFEPLQNCYWSSNQRDAENAWYKCFSDNGVESYIPKANNNYRVNVRAVRKVEWPLK